MTTVTTTFEDDLAIVRIDNPPINAASQAVRGGLADAVKAVDEARVSAAILICEGRTFVAGADIREFDQPPKEPHLPDVIAAIEAARTPWIAAIHGTALGGGLELALGCRYRIAHAAAQLGLPEVLLGLVPGAGGTVRLPRLIPALTALDMAAGGKPVAAERALALGLVDRVVEDDLLAAARDFAREVASRPAPAPLAARAIVVPPSDQDWSAATQKIAARARGQNSPLEAAAAVRDAIDLPSDEALAAERARFLRLKADPQSAALRHIFFAERSVAKMARLRGVEARAFEKTGVVGGGTMGSGIASTLLMAGLEVVLIERDDDALSAGLRRIDAILDGSVKRGLLNEAQVAQMRARLSGATDYGRLGAVDLVVECVFEDMGVKQEVFRQLQAVTPPQAVLATNTSYLNIGEIADCVNDPSRVLGLHFFSPAHIMRLLEVIHPPKVADDVLATGFALAKRLGKVAVPSGVCEGFIGNRVVSVYRRECDYMLEDGALPREIDAAMTAFGMPMGIYQMQDLAGLDISWAMRKRLAATRDPNERYVEIADRLCEGGRFGRKAGRGWYLYRDGGSEPDPEVEALILAESARRGISRRPFSPEMIMDRVLSRMQTEGRAIVEEGIAASADAVDVVMVNGYGFPRWRGGPMYMAAH